MIENLDGIFENVNFHDNIGIRVHDLRVSENFPEHWHTPMEIICPIENGYRIESGDTIWQLQEGDIAFLRPGTIHALFAPPVGHQVTYLADLSYARSIPHMETLLSLLPPVLVICPDNTGGTYEKIRALLSAIAMSYFDPPPFYETIAYGRLLEVLGLLGQLDPLCSRDDLADTSHSPHAKRLLSVCRYINEHCTENLTLETAAKLAGFSKFHFTRIFKDFTNVSFYHYLNQKRICLAENMLANPEYSITQVALQSGFSSSSSFGRIFRQYKNCSPTEFRKMYAGE